MSLLTPSDHVRGDCSTVHLEAEANLEDHLNANLDASGATVQPADAVERRDDRVTILAMIAMDQRFVSNELQRSLMISPSTGPARG